MANFNKVSVSEEARTELHDKLSLTGAEISINHLSAGGSVPFVHWHKKNEEIYGILSGNGKEIHMDTLEVLTLLLVVFAVLSYIDNHRK